jgi:hypothetical protein
VNKLSLKRFNVNMKLKKKKKPSVNKKKRKKRLKMKEMKNEKCNLEKISKRSLWKKINKVKMTQPEALNPNLIPTKAQNKKTPASSTTLRNTTSPASFLRRH